MSPKQELVDWLEHNRHAPFPYRDVFAALVASHEMNRWWPRLADNGLPALKIAGIAVDSLTHALKDSQRLPHKEEQRTLEEVVKAADTLLKALQGAQPLQNSGCIGQVDGLMCHYAWTDRVASTIGSNPFGLDRVVNLPDALRTLKADCEQRINRQHPNVIERKQGTDPVRRSIARAFVRHCANRIRLASGKASTELLACLASAVCPSEDHMNAKDVENILRTAKDPTKARNLRS
ncbi:hypothetical protein ACKVEX_05545 [Rhodocyclaceae bacterium SMB388]